MSLESEASKPSICVPCLEEYHKSLLAQVKEKLEKQLRVKNGGDIFQILPWWDSFWKELL